MPLLLIAAALALLICAPPAKAADCAPIATLQAHAGGVTIVILKGDDAVRYAAVVDAQPPATHTDASGGLLLAVAPNGRTYIGEVKGDQACLVGNVGQPIHEKAMAAVAGKKDPVSLKGETLLPGQRKA